MQIQSLRIRSYRSFRIDDTTPKDAFERLRKIQTYRKLRAEGCCEATALQAVGFSRAAYYRWQARYKAHGVKGLAAKSRRPRRTHPKRWSRSQEWAVWRMRKRYPFMGKKRHYGHAGARRNHAVGIDHRADPGQGRATAPDRALRLLPRAKKPRNFASGHAQRWKPAMKAAQPGEWVQIDHMTVSRDGNTLKQFQATCPVSKQLVTRVYSRATANNARRFLQTDLPPLTGPVSMLVH